LRDRYDTITNKLGAEVLAVSFADPDTVERYREFLRLPFPVGSDEPKKFYDIWEMKQGSWFQVFHPTVLAKYAKLIWNGARRGRANQNDDLKQMGGDFVVNKEGIVTFAFSSPRSSVRPPIDTLMTELENAANASV